MCLVANLNENTLKPQIFFSGLTFMEIEENPVMVLVETLMLKGKKNMMGLAFLPLMVYVKITVMENLLP